MRRPIVTSLLTLFSVALAWGSKDPWKGKPYQQWTADDLQQILYQSPWSHEVLMDRTWVPYVTKELPTQPIHGSSRAMPSGDAQTTSAAQGAPVHFYVYWASSRVVRAALARRAVLESHRSEAEAYRDVDQPLPDYWIAISGNDMTPFQKNDEAFFQSHAFLQLKKTKQKIFPSKVTYQKGPDGQAVTMVAFYFPNRTSTGDPQISTEEKGAQFTCPIGQSILQVSFEIQKMVDAKGPDL